MGGKENFISKRTGDTLTLKSPASRERREIEAMPIDGPGDLPFNAETHA